MKVNLHLFRIIPLIVFLAHCDHVVNVVQEPLPDPIPELKCEPSEAGELMPLEVGNYWVYQAWRPSTPETLRAEITRTVLVTIAGVLYEASAISPLYAVTGVRPPFEWLYWNGPCGLYWLGGISPTDTLLYKTLLFKYPAEVGESWTTIRINYNPVSHKFYFFDTLTISLTGNYEAIWTPAGDFQCSVYSYGKRSALDVYDNWDYHHYYVPGIGRVAYTQISPITGRPLDRIYLMEVGKFSWNSASGPVFDD